MGEVHEKGILLTPCLGSHQKKGKKIHNSCELWNLKKVFFLEQIFQKKTC